MQKQKHTGREALLLTLQNGTELLVNGAAEALRESDALERRAAADEQVPQRMRETHARLECEERHADRVGGCRCGQCAESTSFDLQMR